MFAAMFPDSKIAAAFACGRAKSTHTVNQAFRLVLHNKLACGRAKGTYTVNHTFRLVLHNKLVEKLKTAPFSMLIDDYK